MNRLRKAAKETARGLGINYPTAITAIMGIGLFWTISSHFSAPVTDSVTGFALWLIETLAWFASLVIVFVPLFGWNFIKLIRLERIMRETAEIIGASTDLADEQMKSFIRHALKNPTYGVARCYAFGSVVRSYATRDVDIIIQFNTSDPRLIRIYRDRLRNVEDQFKEFYGLGLHLQMFLSTEDGALSKFLMQVGCHEAIV